MQLKHSLATMALSILSPFGMSIALAQDLVEPGYAGHALPYPGQGTTGTLSNGDIVAFDGLSVDRYDSSGNLLFNLASFPTFLFGGCFAIAPDESYAIVGESSTHDIFKVALDGSGKLLLTNMVYNYDAAFAPSGELYVSAATCGFSCGNDLIELDVTTGVQRKVAFLQGASGPIAFDGVGNMYYATVDGGFPAAPGSTTVLIFSAADLAAADCATGVCLTEASALTYATGYDGVSDMVLDPASGYAYLAENDFGTGTNRIWRVTGGVANPNEILVEGATFNWIANLEFRSGASVATFSRFQPIGTSSLHYNSTDYFSAWNRNEVQPARANLAISGAGATGPGAGSFEVTGGVAAGAALFFISPTGPKGSSETGYSLAGIASPVFTDLNLANLFLLPGTVASDGVGAASYGFTNPGGITGLISAQAVLLDTDFTTVMGTTPSVDL